MGGCAGTAPPSDAAEPSKTAASDAADAPRLTPLLEAVGVGDFAAAKLLATDTATVNRSEQVTQLSPLHYAAGLGDSAVAVLLLERGAHVAAGDNTRLTPLHHAAENGQVRLIDILLAYGASVDQRGGVNEESPLQMALVANQLEAAVRLVDMGASVHQNDRRGLNPLHTAALFGRTDAVRLLLDHEASLEATAEHGWTPLHLAACRGHADTVAALLERGAAVDPRAANGSTPLLCAAEDGDPTTLRVLLNRGADVTLRGARFAERQPQGWTALHLAAWKGHAEAVVVLLRANALHGALTDDGRSPADLAAAADFPQIAETLRKAAEAATSSPK